MVNGTTSLLSCRRKGKHQLHWRSVKIGADWTSSACGGVFTVMRQEGRIPQVLAVGIEVGRHGELMGTRIYREEG